MSIETSSKPPLSFWRYYARGFLPMVEAAHGRATFWGVTFLMGALGVACLSRWTLLLVPLWFAYSLLRGSWENNQQLAARVQALEETGPRITVSFVSADPVPGRIIYALLVANHGGRATFQARYRILDCSVSAVRSAGHTGIWRNHTRTADIYRGDEEPLLIGAKSNRPDGMHWSLHALIGDKVAPVVEARYVAGRAPHRMRTWKS